jgi:hypothetical protein
MAQFQAFDSNVEVIGVTIKAVIETMGLFEWMAKGIYARYGIVEVKDDGWYSQQAYLDVFREIYEKVGSKTMKIIGKTFPTKVLWPPDITTVEQGLASIDVAYHMNHRGGDIGDYRYEKTGDRSARMVCHNPYPCPFDEGLIEGVATKFAPPGARVRVTHNDPQHCRLKGAESCAYLISW